MFAEELSCLRPASAVGEFILADELILVVDATSEGQAEIALPCEIWLRRRGRRAGSGEGRPEHGRPSIERGQDQHRGDGKRAEERQRIHAGYSWPGHAWRTGAQIRPTNSAAGANLAPCSKYRGRSRSFSVSSTQPWAGPTRTCWAS